MNPWVELRQQLSRRDVGTLLARLDYRVGTVKIVREAPSPSTSCQRWRLTDRLGHGTLRALVEDRQAGLTKKVLAEKYRISLSSVKRVLQSFECAVKGPRRAPLEHETRDIP